MMTIGPARYTFGHSAKLGFALPGVTSGVALVPMALVHAF
jgi:hypothetical protein